MDATPIDFGDARPLARRSNAMGINSSSEDPAAALVRTWSAIHEAAVTVGCIAGVDRARIRAQIDLGLTAGPASDWQNVDDMAEIMRRGIGALLIAHTAGGTPQAAARALWLEFLETRDALAAGKLRGGAAAGRS
jgi:hypothetical protein